MERSLVKQQLYEKYIRPTERERDFYIGIEIEMPVVNLSGGAADFPAVWAAAAAFRERFGFREEKWDENGVCYSATNPETGDNVSFDCSYNNLELSLGRAVRIQELEERFQTYVTFLNGELVKTGHLLTGMGINPNRTVNRKDYIPAERYRMLERYLRCAGRWNVPMYFHPYPDFGAFASASQVQLDVRREHLIDALKGFSLVEPVKAVLFSNSVLSPDDGLLCARDGLWENSTHGINPHNVGMYDCELGCVDDLLEYICTTSIFCAERDGRYLHFQPIPITDYLRMDEVEGEYYDGGVYRPLRFRPEAEDIRYLRTYKFEDLTFRGTIEFRSVCCQPFRDAMTVPAFHAGLMAEPRRLTTLLENDHVLYHHGYSAAELRKLMNRADWPSYVDRDALKRLCVSVLELAREGLLRRGYGEERYLNALYARAKALSSPGRAMTEKLCAGTPMETIVREYAEF